MKIYLSTPDARCKDYDFIAGIIAQETAHQQVSNISDCDCCILLAGCYLWQGNAAQIELDLNTQHKQGKPCLAIQPYGTGYMPKVFRDAGIPCVDYHRSHIIAAIELIATNYFAI